MKRSIKKPSKHRRSPYTDDFYRHEPEDLQIADIRVVPDSGYIPVVPLKHLIDEQDPLDRRSVDAGFDQPVAEISAENNFVSTLENIVSDDFLQPDTTDTAVVDDDHSPIAIQPTLTEEKSFADKPAVRRTSYENATQTTPTPTNGIQTNVVVTRLIAWLAGITLIATGFLGLMVYELKSELRQLNTELKSNTALMGNGNHEPNE